MIRFSTAGRKVHAVAPYPADYRYDRYTYCGEFVTLRTEPVKVGRITCKTCLKELQHHADTIDAALRTRVGPSGARYG